MNTSFSKYKPVSLFWLFLFWAITGLLYLPAYKYGFTLDFLDTLELYQRQSFTDFINREGIDNKSLYQVTQVLLYSLISLFGHRPIPWFFLFTFLHALVAWSAFNFFNRFFLKLDYEPAFRASLVGALLFLINPVQSEVLIWKAAFHYYIGVLMIFAILSWSFSYLETLSNKYLVKILLLYFISTFTLEIFYLTPAFVCALICALALSKKIQASTIKRALATLFVPLILVWASHLFIYHAVYHKWIAHYDVKVEGSYTFTHIFSRLAKYLMHIIGMEYFWKDEWRNKYYELTGKLPLIWALGISVIGIITLGIARWNKWKPAIRTTVTLIILVLLSFALVFPLWFNDNQLMRNDRYYYLPSIFVLMLISVLLYSLVTNNKVRRTIIGLYILLCVWGVLKIAFMTREASKVFYGVIDNFYWYNSPRVLLLNLPNNYNGIGMIPSRDDGYFKDHLKVMKASAGYGKIYDVTSYNITSEYDGAHVTVLDSMTLKVTLNQWGTWWWHNSLGAVDYENDMYRMELIDSGHQFLLHFKQDPNSFVILYQVGSGWKQVDMNNIGGEQW